MFPNRLTAGLCGASWKLREPYPGSLLGENLLSRKQMPEKPSPVLSQPWGSRGQDSWSRTPGDLGAHLPVAGSEWASAAEGDSALPCCSWKGHGWSWPTEPSAHGPARGIVPSSNRKAAFCASSLGGPRKLSLAGVRPQVRSKGRESRRSEGEDPGPQQGLRPPRPWISVRLFCRQGLAPPLKAAGRGLSLQHGGVPWLCAYQRGGLVVRAWRTGKVGLPLERGQVPWKHPDRAALRGS